MHWTLSLVLELAIFCLLLLALAVQLGIGLYRLYRNDVPDLERRLLRWRQSPRWRRSKLFSLLLAISFLCLGIAAAVHADRWQKNRKTEPQQKILPLELHIPNASPNRTYTVVAKFRIQGRPYESSPLQIRFGKKRSPYRLKLYYDAKNPARNSWIEARAQSTRELSRAIVYAIGSMLLGIPLLEALNMEWMRRKLNEESES